MMIFTLVTFAISLWLVKILWVRLLLLALLCGLMVFMLRLPVVDESQQNP